MSDHTHVFAGAGIDRLSEQRGDAAWLADLAKRADARSMLFVDYAALVRRTGEASAVLFTLHPDQIAAFARAVRQEPLLLGFDEDEAPIFAQMLQEPALPEGVEAIDARTLAVQGLLPAQDLGRVGHARSLLDWHAHHAYCANCGAASTIVDGGVRRQCPACGREHFPRVDPVVIMLITHGDTCLLGNHMRSNETMYSTLAGFVEPGESIEEAVRREIFEEAGVRVGVGHYHSSQPWPFPSSLMIGCTGRDADPHIKCDER